MLLNFPETIHYSFKQSRFNYLSSKQIPQACIWQKKFHPIKTQQVMQSSLRWLKKYFPSRQKQYDHTLKEGLRDTFCEKTRLFLQEMLEFHFQKTITSEK